jgi:hypothetical protein
LEVVIMARYIFEKIRLVFTLLCLGLIAIACGTQDTGEDISSIETVQAEIVAESSPTALPAEITEPISPISPVAPERAPDMSIESDVEPIPGGEEALAAAVAHLADKTGVPDSDIRLLSMEAVEWSDASLGCPQEGFMYAQVITPGYLIILEAQGQSYEYHSDQAANVVLCEQ